MLSTLITVRLAAAAGVALAAACSLAGPRVPPNIVIFYADDMGLGDSSAYQDLGLNTDEHQIATPNLERLAAMGTRFTDAHSAAAVCTPSRIGLLSGVHPFRTPLKQLVGYEGQDVIGTYFHAERRTLGWMLRRAGYSTAGYGKWHLGVQGDKEGSGLMDEGPLELGFDTYTGTPGNFGNGSAMIRDDAYMSFDQDWNLVPINSPEARTWDPSDDPDFLVHIQPTNLAAALADLDAHVQHRGERPLFIYYASHSNHTPWIAPDEIAGVALTRSVTKAGAPVPVQLRPDDDGDGIPEPDDPLYDPTEDTHWDPYYVPSSRPNPGGTNGPTERARLIIENDVVVGELLDRLEATDDPRVPGAKLIDNTLFIFTSDNGADLNALPAVGALPQPSDGARTWIEGKKATPWEGGTRVPFIAAWPGRIPAGATSDALIGQVDLYATLAAIVGRGLEPDEAVDSEDVRAALTGGAGGQVRQTDLIYKNRDRLLVRRGSLKLRTEESDFVDTRDRFGDNLDFIDLVATRMFDLFDDLDESNNRIGDPQLAAARDEMLAFVRAAVADGFSRPGASGSTNGANFTGVDLHDAGAWRSYAPELDRLVPGSGSAAIGIICVDGQTAAPVGAGRFVQRRGTIDFASTASADSAISGSAIWRVEGGVLTDSNSAIRIDDGGTLIVDGGRVDLADGFRFLRLTRGDGTVVVMRGELAAHVLAFGELSGSTAGAKLVELGDGDGTLRLTSTDPIRFGDDGSPGDDRISFRSGSGVGLITRLDRAGLLALFDAGRLRIDDLTASELAALDGAGTSEVFDGRFELVGNGDGTTTLRLRSGSVADLSGDGEVDMFDLLDLLGLVDAGDGAADVDGSGVVDQHDVRVFLGLMQREGA